MKNVLLIAATLFAATLPSAHALDRCESEFRRGLVDMKAFFQRMSPACQKEVNLGDRNQDAILRVCTSAELQLALQMQSIENSRLTPLCQDDSCSRLKERGVCVEDQPFAYYLKKFDL